MRIGFLIALLPLFAGCAARELTLRGDAAMASHHWEVAVASYAEARRLAPGDRDVAAKLAAARAGAAEAEAKAARIAAPTPAAAAAARQFRALAWLQQGAMLEMADRPEAAIAAYEASVQLAPSLESARSGLARSRSRLAKRFVDAAVAEADPIAAAGALLQALELDPRASPPATAIRSNAAEALRERAEDELERDRPGLAWVAAAQAAQLAPGAEAAALLAEAGEALDAASRPVVRVRAGNFDRWSIDAEQAAEAALQSRSKGGRLAYVASRGAIPPPGFGGGTIDVVLDANEPAVRTSSSVEQAYVHYDVVVGQFTLDDEETPRDIVETREEIATFTHTGSSGQVQVDVRIRWTPDSGDPLAAGPSFSDSVVAGDWSNNPDDEGLARDLKRKALARLADNLEAEFRWFGQQASADAERLRKSGDIAAAADRAVVAWRAAANAGVPLPDEDADFIRRATGWSVKAGRIDPASLR